MIRPACGGGRRAGTAIRPALLALIVLVVPPAVAAQTPVVAAGVVRSDEKIELKSKLSLPIQRIAAAEGEVVKKGQLLVEMGNEVQRAAVAEAEAALQRSRSMVAEAELKLRIAQRELDRNQSVADLITGKELQLSRDAVDRAAAELQTTRGDLGRAEAQLHVARANFEDTLLRAPFDGLVSRLYVRLGATAKASETTLLDFLTLDRLYVEVAVPLPYLHSVHEGMAVSVLVEEEHRALKTSTSGRIRYVYPEIDTAIRMFRMKVDVDGLDQRILPGMFVKVTLDPARRIR